MNDLVYYSYQPAKKGRRLIIGKHALGEINNRKTDSILIDDQNRMMRKPSIQWTRTSPAGRETRGGGS